MIELTVEADIAEIVLNAPSKLNALAEADLADLDAALIEAEAAGVRALMLSGAGRAFCAGRDINGVDAAKDDALGFLEQRVSPVLRRLSSFPAPTFAVATGACLGIGLGLLIASDVVYVAEGAKIGSPFARLGATLDSGGHALFVERLGAHRTLDLIFTADLMSGAEAVAAGLFSRVLADGAVLDFTREKVRAVAAGPTGAFVASKQLVDRIRSERLGLWQVLEAENVVQGKLSDTENYAEGFRAFQEKRPPHFTA